MACSYRNRCIQFTSTPALPLLLRQCIFSTYHREKTKNQKLSLHTHHFFPGNYFSKVLKLFGCISGDIILCVFKTKASRSMQLYSYFYSVLQHMKDKRYRINRSEFYVWLFGPEKFSGLSRNGPSSL